MIQAFVHTHVFLRVLTQDEPANATRAEVLFRDAVRGTIRPRTSLFVIAEMVWTLESFYHLGKGDIATKMEPILNTPPVECPDATMIVMARDLYVDQNLDFIEAYHAIILRAGGPTKIMTSDRKHFGRVPWLKVSEP